MSKQSTTTPHFSIIIPSLNEEKYLPELLGDLTKQTQQNFEVIHVDGSSVDKTVAEATKFKTRLQLTTKVVKKRNVSFQRNLGAKLARAEWLIFMDADNRLPAHFLQRTKHNLEKQPKIDLFSNWLDINSYPKKQWPLVQIINFGLELFAKVNPATFGALIGVRRAIFKKIKFDENMHYGEDMELVQQLVKNGFHYQCFKNPGFHYNLRRFKKEGVLKLSTTWIEKRLLSLLQGKISGPYAKYPMLGGGYYQEDKQPDHKQNFFYKIELFLRKASKKQLNRAQKIWQNIKVVVK